MRVFRKRARKGTHEEGELWEAMRERLLSDHPMGKALNLVYKARDMVTVLLSTEVPYVGRHRLYTARQAAYDLHSYPQRVVMGI